MGKILVSGASGNVGRYVVKYALAAGQKVKAAGTDGEASCTAVSGCGGGAV